MDDRSSALSQATPVVTLVAAEQMLEHVCGELRFFAGLAVEPIVSSLDRSPRTAHIDWALARAWLRVRMDDGTEP